MGPLAALGGSAISAGVDYFAQQEATEEAMKESRRNRSFQMHMSNSAHTREVQDLRNAGLNPILSATGGSGASTPSGSAANIQAAQVGKHLMQGVGSALESKRLKKDIELADKEKDVKDATIDNTRASTMSKWTEQRLMSDQSQKVANEVEKQRLEVRDGVWDAENKARLANSLATINESSARNAQASFDKKNAEMNEKLLNVDAVLKRVGEAANIVKPKFNMSFGGAGQAGSNSARQNSELSGYTQHTYDRYGEHVGSFERTYKKGN